MFIRQEAINDILSQSADFLMRDRPIMNAIAICRAPHMYARDLLPIKEKSTFSMNVPGERYNEAPTKRPIKEIKPLTMVTHFGIDISIRSSFVRQEPVCCPTDQKRRPSIFPLPFCQSSLCRLCG